MTQNAKLASYRLVGVIWDDAHVELSEQEESYVSREFHKPQRFTLFGLLIVDNEAGVSVATEISGTTLRGVNFIPRQMIVEIVDLGVPKRRRSRPTAQLAPATPSVAAPAQ